MTNDHANTHGRIRKGHRPCIIRMMGLMRSEREQSEGGKRNMASHFMIKRRMINQVMSILLVSNLVGCLCSAIISLSMRTFILVCASVHT